MTDRLRRVVEALGAKRVGSSWMAHCPAHDDQTPSLAIREIDGTVVWHCHAGCSQEAVTSALRVRGALGNDVSLFRRERPAGRANKAHIQQRTTAIYRYTDEHGKPLYEILRREPGKDGGPKDFVQRYPARDGRWIWKKHPRQVLYHLPEVLESPIVFLVEGEKDVETLRAYGFMATTNAGGANAPWLESYTDALRGREVILLPDNDTAGLTRGKRIAHALLHDVARLCVWWPDDAKDVTEWFDRRHNELELLEAISPEEVSR